MISPRLLTACIASCCLVAFGCGKSAEERAKEAEAVRLVAEQEAKAKLEQRFQELVTKGKEALEAKRYDLAVQQLQEAVGLQEDSATLALLQQAKKGRDESRKAAFDAAMIRGKQAEKDKNYPGAVSAFQDALECLPENAEAIQALREAEFLNFREKGRTALQSQKYRDAIQALNDALKRRPEDQETRQLLDQSKQAYDAAMKVTFDAAMARGKTARDDKNYAAAVTAYREALDALPNNANALTALREAQFQNARERGRAALKARKSLDAMKELAEALKLQPNDQESQNLLKDAQAQRRDELLSEGKAALNAKKYPDAIRSFTEAQKFTSDATVNDLLAEAKFLEKREASQKLVESGQLVNAIAGLEELVKLRPTDVESRNLLQRATEAKKRQDRLAYDKLLSSGKSMIASNKFDEAIQEFQKARKVLPDQSEPASLIREAENQKRDWEVKKREFDRLISSGKTALQRSRFDDAIRDFLAAERLNINSAEAKKLLRDAEDKKKKELEKKK
jgi:tetratricopeptide (TPR) repeat protein